MPRKRRRYPAEALVHDSKLTCGRPDPKITHRPTLYDSGRPSSVIWFRSLRYGPFCPSREKGDTSFRRHG